MHDHGDNESNFPSDAATKESAPEFSLGLDAIRERCEKATAGPWEFKRTYEGDSRSPELWNVILPGRRSRHIENKTFARDASRDDQVFIAHARTDIPALIAEVERKQTQLGCALGELDDANARIAELGAHKGELCEQLSYANDDKRLIDKLESLAKGWPFVKLEARDEIIHFSPSLEDDFDNDGTRTVREAIAAMEADDA